MNSQCLKFFVVGVALNGTLGRPSYFVDENEYRHRRQNIEVEVAAEYGSNWDVRNNCGPRPDNIRYPAPSGPGLNLDPFDRVECEIYAEGVYLPYYNCTGTCQEDSSIPVTVECDCYRQFADFQIAKPCEWKILENVVCPVVPENEKVDYECDPRTTNCPAYPPVPIIAVPGPESVSGSLTENVEIFEETAPAETPADQIRQLEKSTETIENNTDVDPIVNKFENFDFSGLLAQLLTPKTSDNIVNIDENLNAVTPYVFTSGSPLGSPLGSPGTGGGVVHNIFNISPVMTNQIGNENSDPAKLDIVTNEDPNMAPEVRMIQNVDPDAEKIQRQVSKLQSEVEELTGLKDNLQFEIQSLRELAENEAKVLEEQVKNSRDRRRS